MEREMRVQKAWNRWRGRGVIRDKMTFTKLKGNVSWRLVHTKMTYFGPKILTQRQVMELEVADMVILLLRSR